MTLFSGSWISPKLWTFLKKFFQFLFLLGLFTSGLAWVMKNQLPPVSAILSEVIPAPVQTHTTEPSFEKTSRSFHYKIIPKANYRLNGMVVSVHQSSAWWDFYHERWQDYLNTADICVVWGDMLSQGIYRDMEFKNGSWTCYPQYKKPEAAARYRSDQLSNNHLIPDTPEIAKIIRGLQKGDQFILEGLLVEYAHADSPEFIVRHTSMIRTDNLCEVVYVRKLQLLRRSSLQWQRIYELAKIFSAVSLLMAILCFLKAPFKSSIK